MFWLQEGTYLALGFYESKVVFFWHRRPQSCFDSFPINILAQIFTGVFGAICAVCQAVCYRAFSDNAARVQKYWIFPVRCLTTVTVHSVRRCPEAKILMPSVATTLPCLICFCVLFVSWAVTAVGTAFAEKIFHETTFNWRLRIRV